MATGHLNSKACKPGSQMVLFKFCDTCVLKFLTLNSILFWPKFSLFTQPFLKILIGMANSVDPDQTSV